MVITHIIYVTLDLKIDLPFTIRRWHMSFRRWRDKTLQCKCSIRHCTASRSHCMRAIIHWTTSKWKCTWRNGIMNHYKKRIACWQDDDEVLQNKTERMERHGWIRWSWITESGNKQIGLRWNVIHLTKTFVAYWISESFCWLNLNRSLDCFAPTNIPSI